ncbi:MAG: TraI domain-containing protein [Enterobacteriaceae bacterium]
MLRSLFRYLPVNQIDNGENPAVMLSASIQVPNGFHVPVSARELLAIPRREQWLQMLWDYSSLPKELYQRYYQQPLEHCVTLMQQFPATEREHHAWLGGMVDHLLETVAYAARLSKNYLLPVGAQPEEQASQSAAWNAVIVYAAMLQSLEGLWQIEVELESGQRWMPLNSKPDEPYRFRFRPFADAMQLQSLGAMLAWKVIPDGALHWLSFWPEVLKTLSLYLTGFRNESGIVNAIVAEAIRTSVGKAKAVSDREDKSGSVEPVFLKEDATGDLSLVMGLADAVQDVQTNAQATGTATTQSTEDLVPSNIVKTGEKFWHWLSEGCCSARFSVNEATARIHIVAGYVFIRAPNIFHQFLSEHPDHNESKSSLQNAFERLGRHLRDNGVMYTCYLYQDKLKEGRFQKMTGYLVVARKLYQCHHIPENNPLIEIKSGH